ncbi:MAG: amino-acid N-acetyltransferase [Methylococcales bacterium]|jgi:amino-acid N-acetyltransferase|nr:amino-acid N-acetyltransferase [Methylococcales bacterium]MBT7445150.1 amino-acid N-acetyltransferase [Methylococcales bacterium]
MTNQNFIDAFRHSSPYIRAHQGNTFVISINGHLFDHPQLTNLIHDLALLNSLGIKLVIAFGARPQIDKSLKHAKLPNDYHHNIRVTTQAAMDVIVPIIGSMTLDLQARFTYSLSNTPMAGTEIKAINGNFITAKPVGIRDGIDHQHTGQVRKVNTKAIGLLLDMDNIILLPPIGFSPTGEIFNLNVEEVAQSCAIALQANKLIYGINEPAVNASKDLTTELSPDDARAAVINNPDLQHTLNAAALACDNGINRTHIINGTEDGALIKELFTCDGSGTLVTQQPFEQIRSASVDDITGILQLIEPLEAEGILIRRSREHIEREIDDFVVIERDNMVIGCAALHLFPNDATAELACLAIDTNYHRANRGDNLLQHMTLLAQQDNIQRILVFTTQSSHWFIERGFAETDLEKIPVERAELYNYQRNSKILLKAIQI